MLLQGKSAVITGSTSGIGLGIARALAEQGADILLNGFGPAAEIGELQKCLAKAYGVRVSYSNADMSEGGQPLQRWSIGQCRSSVASTSS